MKDYLMQLVRETQAPYQQLNTVRECLQARILGSLQRRGAMIPLAFHGGTALRFLFGSSRFSGDLEFALERQNAGYDFRAYVSAIRSELSAEGYAVDIKVSDNRVVQSALVRFPGLPYELAMSPHRNAVLAVKLEVDTQPPAGAGLTTTVVRRHVMLQLQHHDKATLLAGKLHALLQRPFLKGRDVYDLLWYLSDHTWPPPNLAFLNNALEQTKWAGPAATEANWRTLVRRRLEEADWADVADDVRPFLQAGDDVTLPTQENILQALG